MAKCDLTIELADRRDTYLAGEPIRGILHVRVNEDLQCNALTVKHTWATHGRGNVATGDGPAATLFQGKLTAGEVHRLEFTIATLPWPPTYHGHYLNIDHAVTANVDIPWAFDVQISQPIVIVAQTAQTSTEASLAAEDLRKATQKATGCISVGIIAMIAIMILAFALPLAFILLPLLAVIGGAIWFFGSFLPRQKLGPVLCRIESPALRLGENVRGSLSFAPRKPFEINGISVVLTAEEVCVSGSGSNKKTHRHSVIQQETNLESKGQLPSGPRDYTIDVPLPINGPPSLELGNNKIEWKIVVRVDIPRWPDFVHTQPLQVSLAAQSAPLISTPLDLDTVDQPSHYETAAPSPSSGITFAETMQFISDAAGEREQISAIMAGVEGIEFDASFTIERFVLYAGTEDQQLAYPRGRIAYAECQTSHQPVTLYFPADMVDSVDPQEQQIWSGSTIIVGFDYQHGRVRLRVCR
jgi:hypothetical protein